MSDTFQHGVGYIISPIYQVKLPSFNSNTTKSLQPQEQLSRFTLTRTLGFAAPPIFAANGIQFVYNYRKQSPTIFTLSLGMNQALYIYTVSCFMSSLLSYFMSTTLYFLSYPALSRLPIFPGQAAAVLQGLPIISRLSVIIQSISALGGPGWTRTNELRRGQIYSLLPLPLGD